MSYARNYLAAALLLLALGLTGCGRASTAAVPTAPVPVTASHPIERKVGDYADFTSRTAAIESVDVRARVGGYLDKINFKEGTLVKKGDLLCEIDPRPYKAQVDFAKAQVAANEALLKKAQADNLRFKTLAIKSPNAVTQADLDQYQAAEDQAIANVGTAKATLETNELNLGFTKVLSPIDGRTSRYIVTIGNLVQQDVTLLTTIVSVDPIYAYADVDEHTVLHIRELIQQGKAKSARDVELHVKLGLSNEGGFPRDGIVNFVDNQVNPKTGTLRVRAVFANGDQFLTPGMFARVRIPIGEPHEALLITDRAIDTDQGQKIVYIVDKDNKVDSRPVKLGAEHDGLRAIEAGLSPSDLMIVNGLQRIRPGVTVDAKIVEMPGSAALKEQKPEVGDQKAEIGR
jgi:RND family efflux transporter MFP subunit